MTMTLKVTAAGSAMVPDYEAMECGVLRFVGRKHNPDMGLVRPKTADKAGAWVPTGEPVELPYRAEYVAEIKAGTLTPCDAETARACGVPFEPAPVTA